MFSYGRVYSRLTPAQIKSLDFGKNLNERLLFLSRIYFWLFGYPDVASQRRFVMVRKLLRLKKGEKLLDAGCGNGIYLQEFGEKYGVNGVGIDARGDRIKAARMINRYLDRRDVFITSTLERADLKKEKFDKAICLEVLEHIRDDTGVMKKISKNLKKGAMFVLSVPMRGTALTEEQENDPNFKPEKFEHVRSGYERIDLRKLVGGTNLKIVSIEKYFFLTSRYMVKVQQFLYKKKLMLLNLLLSPVLLLISGIDNIIKVYPRGYMVVLKRK